jgi:hypothetical protein
MAGEGRVRQAGVACAIGGVLWVIVLLAAVVAPDAVYDNGVGFRVWEGLLIGVQALLLVGVVGLALSGAAGEGWLGRIGLGIALLGRAAFVVGEVVSFATGTEDGTFIPLGALLTGLGMVLVGIAVIRARRWHGGQRFTPLIAGLYPFVAMFPLFAVVSEPPLLSIALWGIAWIFLGLAIREQAGAAATQRATIASAYS